MDTSHVDVTHVLISCFVAFFPAMLTFVLSTPIFAAIDTLYCQKAQIIITNKDSAFTEEMLKGEMKIRHPLLYSFQHFYLVALVLVAVILAWITTFYIVYSYVESAKMVFVT